MVTQLQSIGTINYLFPILWIIGGIGFVSGVIWLYIFSEYLAAEVDYYTNVQEFNNHALIISRGKAPPPNEIDNFLNKDPLLKKAWDATRDSKAKMDKLWPSGFCKTFWPSLVWSLYRYFSGIFLIMLLIIGGFYVSK